MKQHVLSILRGKIKGLCRHAVAALAFISLAPEVLYAEKPNVAILAGERTTNEFDDAVKKTGWNAKKYSDTLQSWNELKANLSKYDLIVGAPGLKNILPQTREEADALRLFMEKGGAIVLTQAVDPEQLAWLALIDPKLELSTEEPKRKPKEFSIQDGKTPHSFRSTPNKLSDTGTIDKFFRRKNNSIWEWGAGWQNQPCTLVKRFGKGYLVLSTLRHPGADLFENAALMLRFQRQGIAYRSTTHHFNGEEGIVPGRGETRINVTNTSAKPLEITGIIRMNNGTETREIRRTTTGIKPNSNTAVTIPVMADLRGKCDVQVLVVDPSDNSEVLLQKTEVTLPEFLTVLPPAYRGMISTARRDKNVNFKIRLEPINENIEGLVLKLTAHDSKGNLVSEKEIAAQAHEFPAALNLPADAPTGQYTITVAAQRNGATMEKAQAGFKIVPVRPGQVFVDQDTTILRDGKPFFPLGIYHVSGKGTEMEDAANLGFNLYQLWNWDATPENLKRLAEKRLAILWEGQAWGRAARIHPSTSANDPRFLAELDVMRKVAAELKDNPLLAMWYVADEPPPSQMAALRRINNTWHELDENHPTYLVATGNYDKLQEACDILAIDVYPVYRGQRNHLSDVANATDAALKGVDFRKPVIAIPQSFGNNPRHNEKPEDVRCGSYLFLVRGVKGVIWYCWKETGDNTGVEGAGHHPETQKVLKELVGEFGVLAPALMEPGARMFKSPDGNLHAMICGNDETGRYLIYVNADDRAAVTTLHVPELSGKTLTGLFGTAPAEVQSGSLSLNVPAKGTGVFQVK